MRNSIAAYKESLSRIASEVFDAAEDTQVPQSRGSAREDSPASGGRRSSRSLRLTPPTGSPVTNGSDFPSQDEIAKYKADIQKLQASEAEIKALSFNYAAILKEKEEQLSKLREENGSLRRNLDAKEAVGHVSQDENPKTLFSNNCVIKGNVDQSLIRSQRNSTGGARSGNHLPRTSITKQDGYSNGGMQVIPFDAAQHKMELKPANSLANGKEHKNLLEEIKSLTAVQSNHESDIKQLRAQLDSERENASAIMLKLQEERQLNESSQRELHDLKIEKEKTLNEMKELQKELSAKISELRRLQVELSRRAVEEEQNESLESMKNSISALKHENDKLKMEKNELEANLKLCMKDAREKDGSSRQDLPDSDSSKLNEMVLSMQKLEEALNDSCKERDKTLQELARLKQHLLDKELEDSDKMDEDGKVIEELRATTDYQRAHILQLEKALKQEVAKEEELKKYKSDELQKSNEIISELRQKLANCMNTIDSKNVELQNLQTALGQYYAESEARERLGRNLLTAREELARLSESLKAANQGLEASKKEKEEMLAKLSHAERMLSESKHSIQKLEDDNSKLRRALEQSMTTVNRMSLDSDNYVDRRIVIKLLVTYFQRNHSKEVLDLMVRMLGFSEEDKQRIGFAQNAAAGKGVVRGVLGIPGRLVGGILGGTSSGTSSHAPENQSFTDLWVDFLLKETEERERRESEEAARTSSSTPAKSAASSARATVPEQGMRPSSIASFPSIHYSGNQSSSSVPSKQNQSFEHSDAEFATVPLTSSVSPPAKNTFSSRPSWY